MDSLLGNKVKSPLVGLDLSPQAATYVGVLESHLAAYAIQEAKFRALLELLTGNNWDTTKLDFDGRMLQAIAADALVSKGMSVADAKVLVAQRWNEMNEPEPAVVPKAVTPEDFSNVKERFADFKARQDAKVKSVVPQENSEPVVPQEDSAST